MARLSASTTSPARQLQFLALLVVVACAAWGFIWWQAHRFPAARHLAAAQQYLEEGRGKEAESEWKKAVSLDPNHAVTWELLGEYYLATKNDKAAVEALSKVQKLAPETPNVNTKLANALENVVTELVSTRADDTLCFEYLNRLAKLRPHNEQFLGFTGEALLVLRRFQDALPYLDQLVELAPSQAPPFALRGEARFELANSATELKAAEDDLRRALQINPYDSRSQLNLGRLLLRNARPKEAVKYLEAAGQSPHTTYEYFGDLAKAYQRLGNTPKAATMRSRFVAARQLEDEKDTLNVRLRFQGNSFDDNLKMGLLMLRSRDTRNAEKHLEKARQMRPEDARVKAALARLENNYVQNLKEAFEALNQLEYARANYAVMRARMLRPNDPRSANASQLVAAAIQTSIQAPPLPASTR